MESGHGVVEHLPQLLFGRWWKIGRKSGKKAVWRSGRWSRCSGVWKRRSWLRSWLRWV